MAVVKDHTNEGVGAGVLFANAVGSLNRIFQEPPLLGNNSSLKFPRVLTVTPRGGFWKCEASGLILVAPSQAVTSEQDVRLGVRRSESSTQLTALTSALSDRVVLETTVAFRRPVYVIFPHARERRCRENSVTLLPVARMFCRTDVADADWAVVGMKPLASTSYCGLRQDLTKRGYVTDDVAMMTTTGPCEVFLGGMRRDRTKSEMLCLVFGSTFGRTAYLEIRVYLVLDIPTRRKDVGRMEADYPGCFLRETTFSVEDNDNPVEMTIELSEGWTASPSKEIVKTRALRAERSLAYGGIPEPHYIVLMSDSHQDFVSCTIRLQQTQDNHLKEISLQTPLSEVTPSEWNVGETCCPTVELRPMRVDNLPQLWTTSSLAEVNLLEAPYPGRWPEGGNIRELSASEETDVDVEDDGIIPPEVTTLYQYLVTHNFVKRRQDFDKLVI